MDSQLLRQIIEGAIIVSEKPLDIANIEKLFDQDDKPEREEIRAALDDISSDCRGRGFELVRVASGYRFQTRESLAKWVNRVWEVKPKKFSRAMLETLALIAYRQPTTRGDIESVRGVSVSSDIIKALEERGWIRVVGHRDVPGKPELLATTKAFLDYFNLKKLDQLPPLSQLKDFAEVDPAMELSLNSHSPDKLDSNALSEDDNGQSAVSS